MPNNNFFQSIFCAGKVNKYIANEVEEKQEDLSISFELEDKSGEIFGKSSTLITEDVLNDDDLLDSQDIVTNFGENGVNSDFENKKLDMSKTPIVSGFIFDDVEENDEEGFDINNKINSDIMDEDIDKSAQELIDKLKSSGIEKEREIEAQKHKEAEIYRKEAKVESEIDMPLI